MTSGRPDYNLATVMKGLYGTTLKIVAVDASGNIVGVLQGYDGSALRTLNVDDSGRILAVLTDPEDALGNSHSLGAAELAARLGSIVTYDRRGDVVLLEDFEGAAGRWDNWQYGDLYDGAISAEKAHSGSFSYKLPLPAGAGSWGYIDTMISLPVLGSIGVEFSFAGIANIQYLDLELYLCDGAKYYYPFVRIQPQDNTISLCDEHYDLQVIDDDLYLFDGDMCWHTLKVVYDWGNGKYKRLLIDGKTYDLSGYGFYWGAATDHPSLELGISAYNNTVLAQEIYFDDVIITQNEP